MFTRSVLGALLAMAAFAESGDTNMQRLTFEWDRRSPHCSPPRSTTRFVKIPGHVDQYEGVTVNFIPGRTPELVIFDDDDKEVERVNLSHFVDKDDVAKVHELVQSKGFKKKASAEGDEEGPHVESAPTAEVEL